MLLLLFYMTNHNEFDDKFFIASLSKQNKPNYKLDINCQNLFKLTVARQL